MAEKNISDMTHEELYSHLMMREGVFANANAELRKERNAAQAEVKRTRQALEEWKKAGTQLSKDLDAANTRALNIQKLANDQAEAWKRNTDKNRKEMDRRARQFQEELELSTRISGQYMSEVTSAGAALVHQAGFAPDEVAEMGLAGAIGKLARRQGMVTKEAVDAARKIPFMLEEGLTTEIVRDILDAALPHMFASDTVTRIVIGADYKLKDQGDGTSRIVRKDSDSSWLPKETVVWAVTKGDRIHDMTLAGVYLDKSGAVSHAEQLNAKEPESGWQALPWVPQTEKDN